MKYEAMRRTVKKKKLHPEDEYSNSLIGKRTVEILSEEGFDSPKQIQRYLKIADMIPEMLEKLDYGLISFHPAFEIAFLKPNEQRMLLDAMDYAQSAPSVSQAQRIKKLSQMNKLTLEAIKWQFLFEEMSEILDTKSWMKSLKKHLHAENIS